MLGSQSLSFKSVTDINRKTKKIQLPYGGVRNPHPTKLSTVTEDVRTVLSSPERLRI